MKITYEDIVIREAKTSDAAQLAAWWNDGAVMAHAGFPNGIGVTEGSVRKQIENGIIEGNYRHIIEIGGIPVGEMNYRVGSGITATNADRADQRTAEIGIKICHAAYQNQGYGTKACRLFIHELFDTCGFTKIILDTNMRNIRAQKVYEKKLGFRKVKVVEKAWRDQLGEWQTVVFYELTLADYKSSQSVVRLMTGDDYDAVYALWRRTPGMGLNNLDDSREGIQKYLQRNPQTSFVAENHDTVVGTILAGHDGRRGFIYHTCVDLKYRGIGIGKKLVDAALTALRAEGIHKVALVVYDRNESGNAFWEHIGFTTRPDLVYRDKTLVHMEQIDT